MRSSISFGTVRYRATVASIAIHTSAISERAYVYSGTDASARRLLYLEAHSLYTYVYPIAATVLQNYTYYPIRIAHVKTYYRESNPLRKRDDSDCKPGLLEPPQGPRHSYHREPRHGNRWHHHRKWVGHHELPNPRKKAQRDTDLAAMAENERESAYPQQDPIQIPLAPTASEIPKLRKSHPDGGEFVLSAASKLHT